MRMIRTKSALRIVVMLSLLSFLGAFGIGCACFNRGQIPLDLGTYCQKHWYGYQS